MKTTAFVNGAVFVGDGTILEDATVLVEGNRIVKVSDGATNLPQDARTIPLSGRTLLPGLMDCHTHLCLDASGDPFGAAVADPLPIKVMKAARNAEKTLLGGVTTVRDMGGVDGIDLHLRDAVRRGLIQGPRILAVGSVICITGGHGWPIGREADGPDEMARAVREQVKAGVDLVKLMVTGGVMTPGGEPGAMQMTGEELRACVREARRAGKKAAAHAKGAIGIVEALRAGIDSIEHGTILTEEATALMLEKNVPVVLTLSALHHMERVGVAGGVCPLMLERALGTKPERRESHRLVRETGVPTIMGTDAGTPFNPHGDNLGELERLVEVGFTPVQALAASTGAAARALGLEQTLGTIAEGKLADLVLVDGNPLEDIALLNRKHAIRAVMQDGKFVLEKDVAE